MKWGWFVQINTPNRVANWLHAVPIVTVIIIFLAVINDIDEKLLAMHDI